MSLRNRAHFFVHLCYNKIMIELLILYVILKRDYTMYSIQKRILDIFAPYTNPSFGALKPALKKLEKKECLNTRNKQITCPLQT